MRHVAAHLALSHRAMPNQEPTLSTFSLQEYRCVHRLLYSSPRPAERWRARAHRYRDALPAPAAHSALVAPGCHTVPALRQSTLPRRTRCTYTRLDTQTQTRPGHNAQLCIVAHCGTQSAFHWGGGGINGQSTRTRACSRATLSTSSRQASVLTPPWPRPSPCPP